LKDDAVLVTGANGGIGQVLCKELKASGYVVVATDLHPAGKPECDSYIQLDLSDFVKDEDRRTAFKKELVNKLDGAKLVGLINNAAVQLLSSTDELDQKGFSGVLDINVTAPFLLIKLCLDMLESGHGSVVNIGSIHANLTKPRFVAYATSKSALAGLTRALAVDLGGRIRINAIQPAAIETDMLVEGFKENVEGYTNLQKYHPIGTIGQAKDVANTVLFLISKESRFIHGEILNLSGGIHARLHDPE